MRPRIKEQLALRPDYFFDFRSIGKEKKPEETEETLKDNERVLLTLSSHSGWAILKDYIGDLTKELDTLNQKAIESGASFEEIGRNSVVIQLCKEVLQKVINKVEDVKEWKDTQETPAAQGTGTTSA